MDLDPIIQSSRVIVTCGAGGVGKTTCAAAIGCRAVQLGRRTVVLTVDPARRLASSLGLERFEGEACRVAVPTDSEDAEERFLDAMMLDTSSTYDRLVRRYSEDEEQAEAILTNRFYRHFSGAVGGSHEYTAMERLYELLEEGRWDLLILDTPPTVHALDFLDAPQRLIDAFDESIFRWIIKPYLMAGKVGVQVLSFGSAYVLKTLTRFVGGDMIEDLSEFLILFQGMFEGFRQRALAVQELLHDEKTVFLVVATPLPSSLQDAGLFHREIRGMNLPFGGFILNRTCRPLDETFTRFALRQGLSEIPRARFALSEEFLDRLYDSQQHYQMAAMRQKRNVKRFLSQLDGPKDAYFVSLFDEDISDVAGLLRFSSGIRREDAS